ncbi:hypothetical protein IIA16_03480 [bacterium]|nr:hypothetical protein [bacterium]
MQIPWKLVVILAIIALIATYFLSGGEGDEDAPRQLSGVASAGPVRA